MTNDSSLVQTNSYWSKEQLYQFRIFHPSFRVVAGRPPNTKSKMAAAGEEPRFPKIWISSLALIACCGVFVALIEVAEGTEEEKSPRVINAAGNCTRLKCETRDENNVVLQYFSGHAIDNHTLENRSEKNTHEKIDMHEK